METRNKSNPRTRRALPSRRGKACVQVCRKDGDVSSPLPSSCLGSETIVAITITPRTASYCLLWRSESVCGEARAVTAGSPSAQPCRIGAGKSRKGGMKRDLQAANAVIIKPPGRVFSCTSALHFMLCQRTLLTGVCCGRPVLFNTPFNLILFYFCLQQGLSSSYVQSKG